MTYPISTTIVGDQVWATFDNSRRFNDGSIRYLYDMKLYLDTELSTEQNHAQAAMRLAQKHGLDGAWYGASLEIIGDKTRMIFVADIMGPDFTIERVEL